MESQIHLVRHGRSARAGCAGWVDAAGVRRWREAYEAAGIAEDSAPPAAVLARAARPVTIVTSESPRAVSPAERIASGQPVIISPLLRETELDIPGWVPCHWPSAVWESLIHAQWGLGVLRGAGAPPEEIRRADAAAAWLGELARDRPAVVVTHGVFRRLLWGRLRRLGWRVTAGRSLRPWSVWSLRRVSGAANAFGRAGSTSSVGVPRP